MFVYEARVEYLPTLFTVSTTAMKKPEDIYEYMKDILEQYPCTETFWSVNLNTRHHALGRHLVTIGTATASLAHPREVFRSAIISGATAVAVVHNHPSGDPTPSSADLQVTRQLREASRVVGIELLDHVILGRVDMDPNFKGFYSFRSAGLL